jgi:hypothetical protein
LHLRVLCLNIPNVKLYAGYIIRSHSIFSSPIDARPVHVEGGQLLRFSQLSEHYIATVGQSDLQLKVTHVKSKHPALTASLQVLISNKLGSVSIL